MLFTLEDMDLVSDARASAELHPEVFSTSGAAADDGQGVQLIW